MTIEPFFTPEEKSEFFQVQIVAACPSLISGERGHRENEGIDEESGGPQLLREG